MSVNKFDPNDLSGAPITGQKISEQMFERLWSMIVSGELAPGDSFPSEHFRMDKSQVGRPVVREAMQALSNKGVITISQGARSRVNELNPTIAMEQVDEIAKLLLSSEPSNLTHIKQVRKILETGTVQLAARHCTSDHVLRLRGLIDAQRLELGNPQGFILADVAFHVAIAELSQNPLLQVVMCTLLTCLVEYHRPALLWSGHKSATLLDHVKLVDYLESHDVAGAVRLIEKHLDCSDPFYAAKAS